MQAPTIIVQPETESQAVQHAVKTKVNPVRSEQERALQQSSEAGEFAVCEICGGFLKDRSNLLLHFQFAHKINLQAEAFLKRKVPPLKCTHCVTDLQYFWTYQGMHKHIMSAHKTVMGNSVAAATPNNARQSKKAPYDEIKDGQCLYCLQKFSKSIQPDGFWVHMTLHGIVPSSVLRMSKCCACGLERTDPTKMVLHVRTKHPLLFSKISKEQLEAEKSSTAATGANSTASKAAPTASKSDALIKVFRCNHCDYQHMDRDCIRKHVNSTHLFKCSRCKQRFDTRDNMQKHYNKAHASEKDKCPICGVAVRCGRPFVRHMKSTHTRNCSVVLPRMRKAEVRERQAEVYAIVAKAPKGKKNKVTVASSAS